MQIVKDWIRRHFYNQQVVILGLLLLAILFVIIVFAEPLTPVLASVVIAYLLQAPMIGLRRLGVPHLVAVIIVLLVFLALVGLAFVTVVPLLVQQLASLLEQIPAMLAELNALLATLPDRTDLIDQADVQQINQGIRYWVGQYTQAMLSFSFSSIPVIASLSIYLFLIPVVLFFLLKDQQRIVAWFVGFLPKDRRLTAEVWSEVDGQIGNYARGKIWEIIIVAAVAYVTFLALGVQYALLLALMTGFSVLVPLIGAIAVTFPVAILAYFQYGWDAQLAYVVLAYIVIQQLDGNVLQPVLFSEAVKLHPIAIIVAVLTFGWIWGFWGVMFAIPLATVVNAILRAWPRGPEATTVTQPDAAPAEPPEAAPAAPPERPRLRARR